MRAMTMVAALAALLISPFGAMAQSQPPAGPAARASGSGPVPGRGPGSRFGTDYTPGWAMMSSRERDEHRARMRSAQTADACREIMTQHHQQMSERAKERGRHPLSQPRRDACAGFAR